MDGSNREREQAGSLEDMDRSRFEETMNRRTMRLDAGAINDCPRPSHAQGKTGKVAAAPSRFALSNGDFCELVG